MKYSEYAPTGFDARGLALDDRQDWIVLPVQRNRDSGVLDESNFSSVLDSLGGESETCEVHRFGHWACGWLEIILVHPDREAEADEVEGVLMDYPIFSDDDFSERQGDAVYDLWYAASMKDRIAWCAETGVSIFAARRDDVPERVYDDLSIAVE